MKELPAPTLVPRLGPLPPGSGWLLPLSLLLAWVLCLPASARPQTLLVGGPPDLPGLVHTASQIAERGLGPWSHSRLLMYPSVHNLYAQMSFPADAVPLAPLVALLGWPAGFTVGSVLILAALGWTSGRLAARWWRSLPAGAVAVVAAETSGIVLREVNEGRLTHVLGLALAPLAVGAFARALVEDRGRWSLLAGVLLGLSALVFWYQAAWLGLMLLALWLAGLGERLRTWPHLLWGLLGTVLVAGFPLVYTALHAGAHPGSQVGPWTLVEEIPGQALTLTELLEHRDVFGMGLQTGAWGLRPVLAVLAVVGLLGFPLRRRLAPVAWIATAWLLGMGPVWRLFGVTVLSPVFFQGYLPLLRRYWWPDRYLLVASLGVTLLVAGGVARLARDRSPRLGLALAGVLGAVLVVEARLALPTLPMAATWGGPTERSEVLAQGEGPLLVVPPRDLDPGARNKVWSSDVLIEQVHHGRPLLVGPMNPEAVVAGDDYRDFWSVGVLDALRACESAAEGPPELDEASLAESRARLVRAGLVEVLADPAKEGPDEIAEPWRACLSQVLGEPTGVRGPYRVYSLARAP